MHFQLSLLLLFLNLLRIDAEPCNTPSGEEGECIRFSDCPALVNIFANPVNGTEEVLHKFGCGSNKRHFYVCCTRHWNSTNYGKGLSDRRYCGYQHTDDYFSTGNTTSIDEFPWLAGLLGNDPHTHEYRMVCHGTLINNRYILTGAECFTGENAKFYNISKVLLGKYDAENATGCVDLEWYGPECSEAQEFSIEEKIAHPFYHNRDTLNDIALLRLNKMVSYTDYIRPICLPTQGTKFANVGEVLYTTGWGINYFREPNPTLKKKIHTTLVSTEDCQRHFSGLVDIIPTYHICTLDSASNLEFSCSGGAGAPIMFSYKHQWHIEGIVSQGNICGAMFPGIHTRVSNYLDWIKQNIRP